ncbi:uncharacterized protein (TIGR02597 family) [Prosthecobacter fusiformis]|uniref:Uncharacterized protein (TIGR02597 family) n=2 Tax=Prosthecobacter fusiformis TaxID=48464 RepID=A0A4V3FFG3_9BACT|nr:uncharacterized protein (TIGR02597 family) [Prosthecobacter fusiformis]
MVAMAQLTVYSDVAGFDTVSVAGTGGAESKLTFAATEFLQSAKYLSVASAVGPNTLTDSSATWSDDEFNGNNGSHYVEIISVNGSKTGAGVGVTRSITDTEANSKTITLDEALPEGLIAPLEYRIVSHWTLAAIFGSANMAGLQGGSPLSADHVQLWNGTGYDSYYYQTSGIGGTGWRKLGDQSTDASNAIIRPEQNVIIKRVGSAGLPIVLSGWVKTGQTSFDIVPGFNFVPNPYSTAMTLASSGLYKGNAATGIAAGNVTSADQVMLWNGSSYETFYYQTLGLGGTGWRKVGDQSMDASGASIAPGSSIILRRKNPDRFTWAIPQH